jgi:hypothetical protein
MKERTTLRVARVARASERGAVMVESLIAISIMITFFFGMVYLSTIYHDKIYVQQETRYAAYVLNGCPGYVPGGLSSAMSATGLPRKENLDTKAIDKIYIAQSSGQVYPNFLQLEVPVTTDIMDLHVSAPSKATSGPASHAPVASDSYVWCPATSRGNVDWSFEASTYNVKWFP